VVGVRVLHGFQTRVGGVGHLGQVLVDEGGHVGVRFLLQSLDQQLQDWSGRARGGDDDVGGHAHIFTLRGVQEFGENDGAHL
jgi:hypothetical protein